MSHALFTICFLTIFACLTEANRNSYFSFVGIVNGTNARDGEFPYMIQLKDAHGSFRCGGSIIGEKWILTAGHCVTKGNLDSVVYGTNALDNVTDPGTTVKIKDTYVHPKFYFNITEWDAIPVYDIAVIELPESLVFNDRVRPVAMPSDDDASLPFHANGTLTGWGYNNTWGEVENYLKKTHLRLLNDRECLEKIVDRAGETIFNSSHNLCSDDYLTGGCSGDSGSPYVFNGTLQLGVMSWSIKPCGSQPGAYSRITNPEYRQFIKDITGI